MLLLLIKQQIDTCHGPLREDNYIPEPASPTQHCKRAERKEVRWGGDFEFTILSDAAVLSNVFFMLSRECFEHSAGNLNVSNM